MVFMHPLQDLLEGQKDMKTVLERFLEKLSPPSLEALPVTLMLLPHVNQLDKVLCTSVYTYLLIIILYSKLGAS